MVLGRELRHFRVFEASHRISIKVGSGLSRYEKLTQRLLIFLSMSQRESLASVQGQEQVAKHKL